MKHTQKFLIFTAAFSLGCSCLAFAEEADTYHLEPETVYQIDFQNDGTEDTFSFDTYTEETLDGMSRAVLNLTLNGATAGSYTADEWSYCWKVSQCPLEDGTVYLTAACISDNDWNTNLFVLKLEDQIFTPITDLVPLTRLAQDEQGTRLNTWARVNSVSHVEGNTFTAVWYENTKAAGNIEVLVTYALENGTFSLAKETYSMDETKDWTAWKSFTVQDAIGEASVAAYQVEPGETVHLTEYVKDNEKAYFKCVNEQGEEGWLPDADEYVSQTAEDGINLLCGYFEEAYYAG